MDLGIRGKKALVLGASRGLGAACAAALVDEGVEVIAAARTVDSLAARPGIRRTRLDLADENAMRGFVRNILEEGGVDILVNNGGGPAAGPARGQPAASWSNAFSMMALPLFAITDALLAPMIERQWGRIITIGSSGIVQPIAGLALSNGVRTAVAAWSKTLAAEVARDGVTVNMVLPGRINTDRVRELDAGRAARAGITAEEAAQESLRDIPAGRYGHPEEFASVVTFLASRQASYVTGAMLRVDGGMIRGL